MKKVVSFCVFGNDQKYTYGAIRNAELAAKIYPEWQCWFYIATDVDANIVDQLRKFPNSRIITAGNNCIRSTLWRFYPASDPDVDVFISRDTDSRINRRERAAVNQWLESGKSLHVMRDHHYHTFQIMAGMWGFRGLIPNIQKQISEFISSYNGSEYKYFDQLFLASEIYNKYVSDAMIHDSANPNTPGNYDFPTSAGFYNYVGFIESDGMK